MFPTLTGFAFSVLIMKYRQTCNGRIKAQKMKKAMYSPFLHNPNPTRPLDRWEVEICYTKLPLSIAIVTVTRLHNGLLPKAKESAEATLSKTSCSSLVVLGSFALEGKNAMRM